VTTNAPDFDPLHCSFDDDVEMLRGYIDGLKDRPTSGESMAYAHGRRNGVNDRLGVSDPEQLALARRRRTEHGMV
jgi:hypothetical protein